MQGRKSIESENLKWTESEVVKEIATRTKPSTANWITKSLNLEEKFMKNCAKNFSPKFHKQNDKIENAAQSENCFNVIKITPRVVTLKQEPSEIFRKFVFGKRREKWKKQKSN